MDHVFYDIQVDSVPPELKPPASIEKLLEFKVQGQKFSKKGNENDIIERYTRLTRESTFTKLDRTSYLEIFGKPTQSDSNSLDGSNHIPTITSISDQKVNEEEELAYTSPPVLTKTGSYNVVEDFTARQEKLDKMVTQTGQTIDVCHFYLEMVNWDLDNAIQMFGSFSSNS